jgi:hypothetical protein
VPGCPTEHEAAEVNGRARAKAEALSYWTPIADRAGLPSRTPIGI